MCSPCHETHTDAFRAFIQPWLSWYWFDCGRPQAATDERCRGGCVGVHVVVLLVI